MERQLAKAAEQRAAADAKDAKRCVPPQACTSLDEVPPACLCASRVPCFRHARLPARPVQPPAAARAEHAGDDPEGPTHRPPGPALRGGASQAGCAGRRCLKSDVGAGSTSRLSSLAALGLACAHPSTHTPLRLGRAMPRLPLPHCRPASQCWWRWCRTRARCSSAARRWSWRRGCGRCRTPLRWCHAWSASSETCAGCALCWGRAAELGKQQLKRRRMGALGGQLAARLPAQARLPLPPLHSCPLCLPPCLHPAMAGRVPAGAGPRAPGAPPGQPCRRAGHPGGVGGRWVLGCGDRQRCSVGRRPDVTDPLPGAVCYSGPARPPNLRPLSPLAPGWLQSWASWWRRGACCARCCATWRRAWRCTQATHPR